MKLSQDRIPIKTGERPLGFCDFIRWAVILTLGVTAVTLVIAVVQCYPEVWAIGVGLYLLAVLAICVGIHAFGCVVMISVGIWKFRKWLSRKGARRTIPQGQLWDRWIDGP